MQIADLPAIPAGTSIDRVLKPSDLPTGEFDACRMDDLSDHNENNRLKSTNDAPPIASFSTDYIPAGIATDLRFPSNLQFLTDRRNHIICE